MKAITLWQPWASLLACGAKHYETRSWPTNYRGPIAIHAAKTNVRSVLDRMFPFDVSDYFLVHLEFTALSVRHDFIKTAELAVSGRLDVLPLGAVIAVADLVGCHKIEAENDGTPFYRYNPTPSEILKLKADFPGQKDYGNLRIRRLCASEHQELLFGDWTPGRYAWEFANVTMLTEPVPTRGMQGLWEWKEE